MKLPSGKEREKLLNLVEERRASIEDSVKSVCHGFTPALFVWGSPGLGKSHLLTTMLHGLLGTNWRHHTTYSTPKGIVLSLAENPDQVHVFEDCEAMIRTGACAAVLRAACGAPADRERWVTWETAHEKLKVKVTGGIIIVTNENLARRTGPMQGVASRFRPVCWHMTTPEIMATIASIADNGWKKGTQTVTPKECHKVAESLAEILTREAPEVPLDIRLYCEHALPAYAYSKHAGKSDWESVLAAKITGTAKSANERQTERTDRLQKLAQLITSTVTGKKERLDKWKEATGLGKSIFYRYAKVKG